MHPIYPLLRVLLTFSLLSACVSCRYYKEQSGYLVTRSEAFSHHYEGSPCGLVGKSTCDMPETRYTLAHRGIRVVVHCQSWDERNKCGQLQVGEAYKCDVEGKNDQFGPQLLTCEGTGSMGIEHSEQQ